MSENYYQYADHFLRVIEQRNALQNNSKSNSESSLLKNGSANKIVLEDEKISPSEESQKNKEI